MSKNHSITFRTSVENREKWEAKANDKGLNLTEYILQCLEHFEQLEEDNLRLEQSILGLFKTFEGYRVLERMSVFNADGTEDVIGKRAALDSMFRIVEILVEGLHEKKLVRKIKNGKIPDKKRKL